MTGVQTCALPIWWDESTKKASVTITQTQEGEGVVRVFDLPLTVDLYDAAGKVTQEGIRLTKRSQTFTFDAPTRPALINTDSDRALLAVKRDNHTPEEWAFMYRNAPQFLDRWEALEALGEDKSGIGEQVFKTALKDKFYGIRQKALQHVDPAQADIISTIAEMADKDTEPGVKATAMQILGETGDKKYVPLLQKGLGADQPYSVVGAALSALTALDPQAAVAASKVLQNDESEAIIPVLTELYGENPDRSNLPFFEQKIDKVDYMGAFSFFESYRKVLVGIGDPTLIGSGIDRFKKIALDGSTSQWRRFGATKAIADIRNYFKEKGELDTVSSLRNILNEIKEKETDATLKMYYNMFDEP